jgi:alkanesulfonate monooxygenase SsuD/methylene tetrahydromethanopterin reductase-like flavin-dependent oxidoreductase (luciferase family)
MNNNNLAKKKISVLDLAIVRDGGTASDTFKNSLDIAQHVEKWGYDRFWLAEHHNMPGIASSATSILIGYASGTTTH